MKSYNCRFCGEPFVPTPAVKPGYVDECPECFYARTHPTPAVDVISRMERGSAEQRRALDALRRDLVRMGIKQSDVDDRITKMMAEADKLSG